MPQAEWLSEKAKTLSTEIFQDLCTIRDENRSSACEVRKLQSINNQVGSNGADAWVLGLQAKTRIQEAADKLGDAGEAKLTGLQHKLIQVLAFFLSRHRANN